MSNYSELVNDLRLNCEQAVLQAPDVIETQAKRIAELEEALKPLAYIDIELLDKDGKPTGVYAFDAYHEHQVVFGIGKDRTITANDLRRARTALGQNNSKDMTKLEE